MKPSEKKNFSYFKGYGESIREAEVALGREKDLVNTSIFYQISIVTEKILGRLP